MIPFPRLLQYGNTPDNTILLVDFSKQNIGDTMMIDQKGTAFIQQRTKVGTVEYDAEIGQNVMNCNGSIGYFRTKNPIMGTRLDLTRYNNFTVEIKYKGLTATGVQSLWETGNFQSRRIYGIANTLNQYAATYFQWFLDNGSYNRVLPPWTNPLAWDTVTVTYQKGANITVQSALKGGAPFTTTAFPFATSADQYMSLFGSYVTGDLISGQTYSFTGKIAYIKMSVF